MIKLFIRSTRKLLAITLVCLCALPLFAQNSVTVSGSLTDASNGDPLIGAYLIVKDSGGLSAVTDLDGKFSISIPASLSRESVVEINYVGYETRTLTVADILSSSLIKMSPLGEVLEEVLVVGYGVQKKASSVGSITQAKGEELLKTGNVNTVSEAMQGRLNGVISINTTGQPGANSATIFIRGKSTWQNTNPLVLVDGIERDMNDVDFNEIESVSVLKDASATAVYGVRGGNGVILLTTKRGDQDRPTVNFNTNVSLKEPTANIYWADYMTSMQLYNEGLANDQNWNSFIPQSTLNAWQNAFDTGNYGPYNDYFPQIDWYGEMIREAVSRNYNINVNGRSDFMKYFASVGYQFDDSIYNTQKQDNYDPRSWYKRLNWRANFDFDLTPTTTFSVGIAGKMGIRNTNFFGGVINLLARAPTNTFPIKWSDGYFGDDSNRGANPIADLNYGGQSQFQSFQGWYDAKLVQKLDFITEGLKAHAQVSFNQATATRSNIKNGGIFGTSDVASQHLFPREYRTYDYSSPVIGPDGSIAYPIIESASGFHGNLYYATPQSVGYDNLNSVSRLLYYEIGLNYARTFGNHEVTAMALMNRQKREESSNGSTFAFPSFMEDWVGRVTYNWKERYLAEFNISYTGSEKFAPGKRFGLFPSYSIGWRVTEEPWMQWSKDVLSNMKIRYSWGKVGNDRGADRFQYIQLYTQESNVNFGWKENVAFGPSYKEGDIAQPNATWETSVKQNIGLEIGLWKKLRTTIDLFDEQRSGILLSPRTTAAWVGVDIASANLGRTKNHGIDLELSWNDKIGKDFHYTASFMFSTSENRILYKDDPANYLSHEKDAGKPVGWQSRFITIGNYEDLDDIYNAAQTTFIAANKVVPGDLVYVDFNADGTINNKDNIVQQQLNYPLTTYSLNLSCEWKGLGLSLMFYSPQGQYRNYVEAYLYNWLNGHVKAQPHAEDRWTPATANVTGVRLPSAHVVDTHNQKENTFRYVDYSYVRLKNAEITYQVPKKVQRALHMSKFTVFANGNNLITWWKGDPRIDPETDGQDIYPIVRTYTFGARFSF